MAPNQIWEGFWMSLWRLKMQSSLSVILPTTIIEYIRTFMLHFEFTTVN